MNSLTIILVSWNTRDLLSQCLASIFAFPPTCRFEAWVVDNASTDGTPEMLQHSFPQVHVIQNRENCGFARANNQAILRSQSRYVLLLNPDTVVKQGALENLVRYMDGNPRAGGAGPRLLNPDGSLQPSCYPTPTLLNEFLRLFHLDRLFVRAKSNLEAWAMDAPRPVEIIQGACLILRRSALEQVGYLDERFFIYSEDYDICMSLRKDGWTLSWLPFAEVVHYGGQSTSQVQSEMFLELYENKLKLMRKHYGRSGAAIYKIILFGSALTRVVLIPISHRNGHPEGERYRALGDNYRRLILALPGM
jgi:N-acetylglucosaminyl-diphospho-decaprenol L-rhamnosyltransferase